MDVILVKLIFPIILAVIGSSLMIMSKICAKLSAFWKLFTFFFGSVLAMMAIPIFTVIMGNMFDLPIMKTVAKVMIGLVWGYVIFVIVTTFRAIHRAIKK